jgi:hypothetical protein
MLSVLPIQVFQLAVCSYRKNEYIPSTVVLSTRVRNSAVDVRDYNVLVVCHSSTGRPTRRLCLRHM